MAAAIDGSPAAATSASRVVSSAVAKPSERLSSVARRRRPWARTRSDVADPSSCASISPARPAPPASTCRPAARSSRSARSSAVAGRGPLQRELDQLGGGVGSSAGGGQLGGGVELGRDRAIGAIGAVGEVAGPLLGVAYVLGGGAVGGAPLCGRRRSGDRRGEQWVHERDPPPLVDADDAPLLGGRERRGVDRPGRGLGEDRGPQERALGRRGQLGDPRRRQGAHVVGDRQAGVGGAGVVDDQPCHLQRVERVSARCLGDARQDRARKRTPQAVGDDPAERPQRQRAEPHAPHALALDGVQQPQPRGARPRRAQHADRLGVQPPDGEAENAGRGAVEPLGVIEGHQHRGALRRARARA